MTRRLLDSFIISMVALLGYIAVFIIYPMDQMDMIVLCLFGSFIAGLVWFLSAGDSIAQRIIAVVVTLVACMLMAQTQDVGSCPDVVLDTLKPWWIH